MRRTKRDKAEDRRLRQLASHMTNETNRRIVEKTISGEPLDEKEAYQASCIPKLLKKLIRFKQSGEPTPSITPKKILASKKIVISKPTAATQEERQAFYSSPEWRRLRYRAIVLHGGKCQACGRSAKDGIVIHVDHIKPIYRFPHLKLEITNLQILCEDCNMGKGAWDDTDWREPDPRYGEIHLIANNGRSVS